MNGIQKNNIAPAQGKKGLIHPPGLTLVVLGVLACSLWFAGETHAQLSDNATISTQGTQFVRPKPPQPPSRAKPPQAPKAPDLPRVEQPRAAAVEQPNAPQGPPPRFPSVVMLLDTSDSMLNKVAGQEHTRLEEAKSALVQVVRGMSRETRLQLWVFNNRLFPVSLPGTARGEFIRIGQPGLREKLIGRIGAVRTGGGTNLYQSIIKSLDIFGAPQDQSLYRSGQRFPVLVVISDGEDGGKTGHSLDSVLAARGRFPLVTINTVGFHIKGNRKWFQQLCRIATRPQGCATAGNREKLRTILESFYRF